MAAIVKIDSNISKVLRDFDRLPSRIQTGVKRGLERGLLIAETKVKTKTDIKKRRGARGLMGRLTSNVKVTQGFGVDAVIGFRKTSGFPYELSQEFGAKARPGKAMSIPMTPEAKRTKSPRQFSKPLFMFKRGSRAFLAEQRARSVRVHYVLVKSIPPRLKFRENVIASLHDISRQIDIGLQGVRR